MFICIFFLNYFLGHLNDSRDSFKIAFEGEELDTDANYNFFRNFRVQGIYFHKYKTLLFD